MSFLNAVEPVLPALPTYAPIECEYHFADWVYVVARWPSSPHRQVFVWHIGELYWTNILLH